MASYVFLWGLHGLLGASSIFIIYPLGIVRLNVHCMPSWLPHWIIQSFGNVALLAAAAIGLFGSSNIHNHHQIAGITLVVLMLFQSFIGQSLQNELWQTRWQRWIKHHHAIQGFLYLLVGWWTVITGLRLASFDSNAIIVIGLTTLTEMMGVAVYCGSVRWRKPAVEYSKIDVGHSRGEMATC